MTYYEINPPVMEPPAVGGYDTRESRLVWYLKKYGRRKKTTPGMMADLAWVLDAEPMVCYAAVTPRELIEVA